MSDPRAGIAGAVLGALILSAPGSVRAQHADSAMTRVLHLDSLLAERLAQAATIRERARGDAAYVNVASGPFVVRTAPAVASRVREAVSMAYAAISSRGGGVLESVLATHVPLLSADASYQTMIGPLTTYVLHSDTARRSVGGRFEQVNAPMRVNDLANRLATFAEHYATQFADGPVSRWLLVAVPLRPARRSEWADAYVEYATGESATLRACRHGDASGCLIALGVGDVSEPLDAWYGPEDYRPLTRRIAPGRDSAIVAAWMRCDSTGDSVACERAARSIPRERVPPPLSPAVRRLLLDETLRIGGPRALDRLLATEGSMRERLSAAAGTSVDQVARQWRDRVIAARPPAMRVDAGLLLASIGWSGLLLAVALTRRGTWS